MAFPTAQSLLSPISLISFLSLSSLCFSYPSHPSDVINSSADIHDVLTEYNLPKGILPNDVKSYTLSDDGSFLVEMEHHCYVNFGDDLVYYGKVIKGKLSYGKVSDVSGIQAKKLFFWVSVTGMDMDSKSGMVEFHVGALSEKLPADQFETIPCCRSKAYSSSRSTGPAIGLESS